MAEAFVRTFTDEDGLVHRVDVAPKKRSHQSTRWLACTGENMYGLVTDTTDKVVTCLSCVVRFI